MAGNITFLNQELLEKIETGLWSVLGESGATAVLLVDHSGLVLAFAGDPPLHPNQMGGLAAGVYAGMSIMIKASRAHEFVVKLPENSANLQFRHVDAGVFLCAFYADERLEDAVRSSLRKLAEDARQSLATTEVVDASNVESISFIEEKLNELFKQ